MTDNQKRDHAKFYLDIPEPGFSAAKNKQVVENSIKKYEAEQKRRWKEKMNEYRERADASASFLRAVDRGKNANLDQYFGKKIIAHLRGDAILGDIRALMASQKRRN